LQADVNVQLVFDLTNRIKDRIKNLLKESKELAQLSKSLATIDINAPASMEICDCEIKEYNVPVLLPILKKLEFNSIISKLGVNEIQHKEDLFEILNPKKNTYEPIRTQIVSLGTAAGIVDDIKPGGLVAIGTKLDPSMTRSDSLVGSVIGKPETLPENSVSAKLSVNLFDSAVGTVNDIKVTPIQIGESLRLNIGTAPVLAKISKAKAEQIEVQFKRPVCLFDSSNVALSRKIEDRWRLIGAGVVG